MLTSIAWMKVRNMWKKEMEERPKLGMLSEIAAIERESKLCSVEKEARQEDDDEAKRRYSCIPDRGGKVERSGEGGESM